MVGWTPHNKDAYEQELDAEMAELKGTSKWIGQALEEKCKIIEEAILEMATKHAVQSEKTQEGVRKDRLRQLIKERKSHRAEGQDAKQISKQIRREIRAITRAVKGAKIEKIMQSFKGLKFIADIQKGGKKYKISSMTGTDGKQVSDEQGIADVFADFYESLYKKQHDKDGTQFFASGKQDTLEVSEEEVKVALMKMKNGKTTDNSCIVAEMLKFGGKELRQMMAELFTEILRPHAAIPEYWRQTTVKVLYKSGNAKLPGNYRPISILQILYKAFSRIVCERISGELESEQTRDQAGFRKGYSCEDHLLVITLVAEMHLHSGSPLWIAALDFKKAFDSVSHASMWDSMLEHGVHENYVDVMSRLYAQKTAEVQCCQRSKKFAIQRGTKQGDPISLALFNAVLERCLREFVGKWKWQGYGVQFGIGEEDQLQSLRFADDELLAGSYEHAQGCQGAGRHGWLGATYGKDKNPVQWIWPRRRED